MSLLPRELFDADHEDYRQSVRRFVSADVAPYLDDWRAAGSLPAGVIAAMGEQGFLGTAAPEEHGGAGVDDIRFVAVLVEELAAVGAVGLALVVAHHVGVVLPACLRVPREGRRDAWLAAMVSGESLAVTAPLVGTEARAVPAAGVADLFLLRAEAGARMVARDDVEVRPVAMLGGLEVGAADIEVPESAVAEPWQPGAIGAELDLWSAVVAAAAAEAALAVTIDYVRERKVFGRPIADFENTRFRLAEVGAELAAARLLVDAGLAAAGDDLLTAELAGAARLVAGRAHDHVVDRGMQLHGGYGYMREYPISHAFADARFLRVTSAAGGEPRGALATAIGL